jgi:hypothetical protein
MLRLRLGLRTRGLRCKLHVLYDPFYRRRDAKAGRGIEAGDIAIAASCVVRLVVAAESAARCMRSRSITPARALCKHIYAAIRRWPQLLLYTS